MKVASGTQHGTVCLHVITLYFWLFWGGICVVTVEQLIPNMTGEYPVFPAGHHGFTPGGANSHLILFGLSCRPSQCTLDSRSLMKPAVKNMIHKYIYFFAMLPHMRLSNTCRRIKKQDAKSAALPLVLISWRVLFFLNRRKKIWFYRSTMRNRNQQLRLPVCKLRPWAPCSIIDPSASHGESRSLAASELFITLHQGNG